MCWFRISAWERTTGAMSGHGDDKKLLKQPKQQAEEMNEEEDTALRRSREDQKEPRVKAKVVGRFPVHRWN